MIADSSGKKVTPKKYAQGVLLAEFAEIVKNWRVKYETENMTGRESSIVDLHIKKEVARIEKRFRKTLIEDNEVASVNADDGDDGADDE